MIGRAQFAKPELQGKRQPGLFKMVHLPWIIAPIYGRVVQPVAGRSRAAVPLSASITVQFGLCLPLYWNQAGCRSKKHQKYCLHNGIKQTVDPKTTTSQARRESLTSNSAWMNASTNPTHRVSHKPHLSMDAREADASSSGAAI